jgi:prevent-host-death family protein
MRNVRISQDFVPVSEFKAQAAGWLRKIAETGAPLVVTQNGKPAGVLLSPGAFDVLTEQARFATAVNEGIDDADAGRVHTHASVGSRMKRRFARSRRTNALRVNR